MHEAGLRTRTDTAGNIIARLGSSECPAIICGSHIDTVPNGGRFDGAPGVLAGLECGRVLSEHGRCRDMALEVIAFSDEEGAYASLLGSRAMMGEIDGSLRGGDKGRERVIDMFPFIGERLRQKAGTLSGGEQAMVKVARALLPEPRLVLLDEVTEGLQPLIVDRVRDVLARDSPRGMS
jgi:Peptidase family M28/ABC transporter